VVPTFKNLINEHHDIIDIHKTISKGEFPLSVSRVASRN